VLRFLSVVALFALALIGSDPTRVRAALDGGAPEGQSNLELVVFQIENCKLCELVQTQIRPAYERSRNAKDAPMRFVDINRVDESSLGLAAPVTIVPTIVLMREGREVSRMTGYTGPTIFFDALAHMMRDTE
jgi:hypothetical protein